VENNQESFEFKNKSKRFSSYYQCCDIFLDERTFEEYVSVHFYSVHLCNVMFYYSVFIKVYFRYDIVSQGK
jgi:hypothetical protein